MDKPEKEFIALDKDKFCYSRGKKESILVTRSKNFGMGIFVSDYEGTSLIYLPDEILEGLLEFLKLNMKENKMELV